MIIPKLVNHKCLLEDNFNVLYICNITNVSLFIYINCN